MILNLHCEKCGSPIVFDDTREFMFCWSCGNKIFNPGTVAAPAQQLAVPAPAPGPAQLTPVQMVPLNVMSAPVQNYYNGPNLIVSYEAANSSLPLFFRIHTTNEKFYINPGQSISLRLNQGRHALFFGFGSKYYRRDIRIVLGNAPIKAECSWFNRAQIRIIQSSQIY